MRRFCATGNSSCRIWQVLDARGVSPFAGPLPLQLPLGLAPSPLSYSSWRNLWRSAKLGLAFLIGIAAPVLLGKNLALFGQPAVTFRGF